MGRKSINIERLPPNKVSSTFTKRKKGLANKAKELGILCDCDVALIVVSPKGDELIDVSCGGTVTDVYQKYISLKGSDHNKGQLVCIHREVPAQQGPVHSTVQQESMNQLNGTLSTHPTNNVSMQFQANSKVQNLINFIFNHINNTYELNQFQQALQQRMAMVSPSCPTLYAQGEAPTPMQRLQSMPPNVIPTNVYGGASNEAQGEAPTPMHCMQQLQSMPPNVIPTNVFGGASNEASFFSNT
jgi:hypothetical protein